MKKVLAILVLLCFLIGSIGITAMGEDVASYDTYTMSGTFSGAADGDIISVFVLKEGYTMEDIGSSIGSVMDKVYYTNMFSTGEGGAYSFDITLPEGTSRSSDCVLVCNGVKQQDTLRNFLVSSGSLQVLYAKPGGSTGADGSKDKPYTLTDAKNAAITLAESSDVDVLLYGGKYSYQGSRLQFTSVNVGTGHRITFAPASKDDKPVITSMKQVGYQYISKLTEGDIYDRLPENARGMVYKLDMVSAGFAHNDPIINSSGEQTGTYTVLTMGYNHSNSDRDDSIQPPMLYLNGKRQTLSQYPNAETVAFDNVSGVTGKNTDGYATLSYAEFTDKMNFDKWTNAIGDAYLAGFLTTTYHAAAAKISEIDTADKKVTLETTSTLYYPNTASSAAKFGPRVAIVNLPEEMDIPGEYYFCDADKCIYYYAPYELTADDVFEMANDKRGQNGLYGYAQLVHMTSSENITFEGIEFYGSRFHNSIYISGANKGIEIRNCTVHASSKHGIAISGTDLLVENCNIYDVGGCGIVMSGSVDVTASVEVKTNNIARNNHIYNYGQNPTANTYQRGIEIGSRSGVKRSFGDVVTNNLIHGSDLTGGIVVKGLGQTVSRNEVYNLLHSIDDAGVLYAGRSVVEFGNKFTENYLHDFSMTKNPRYSSMGVYLDDWQSGQSVTRNIIVGPGTSYTQMLGVRSIGYDNVIDNNTFVDIYAGAGLSGRSAASWTDGDAEHGFYSSLSTHIPHSDYEYYDEMVAFRDRLDANSGNMIYKATAINNLVVNCTKPTNINASNSGVTYEYGSNNVYGNTTATSSVFVDPENQDYRVKKSAITAGALSEVPNELNFDMDWIGIQTKDKMPESDKSFKLMHPTQGENLTKDNVLLTWEKGLFADEYEYVIATDESFANTVESGTTRNTFVIPTYEFTEGTRYYWKVTAVNTSRNMGAKWNCDTAQTFTVAKAVDLEVVENTVLSEDGTTALGTLEGVSSFNLGYIIRNNGTQSQEYIVIAALFSDEGKFCQAKVSDEGATLASGETTSGIFEFTPSFTMKDGYYVKVFVVDKPKKLSPLSFFGTALKKQ